jgi:hypothetical protein
LWAPEPVWKLQSREKSLALARFRTLAAQPIAYRYTELHINSNFLCLVICSVFVLKFHIIILIYAILRSVSVRYTEGTEIITYVHSFVTTLIWKHAAILCLVSGCRAQKLVVSAFCGIRGIILTRSRKLLHRKVPAQQTPAITENRIKISDDSCLVVTVIFMYHGPFHSTVMSGLYGISCSVLVSSQHKNGNDINSK